MQETTHGIGHAGAARARLFLGGVGAAVSADVCSRTRDRLTVRHALPFLKLESEVMDEDGRRARISAVRVYVEDDVPTLHMELTYPTTRTARRDETLPYGISTLPPPPAPVTRSREDDTLVFGTDSHAAEARASTVHDGDTVVTDPAPAHPAHPAPFFVRVMRRIAYLFARLRGAHRPALSA